MDASKAQSQMVRPNQDTTAAAAFASKHQVNNTIFVFISPRKTSDTICWQKQNFFNAHQQRSIRFHFHIRVII